MRRSVQSAKDLLLFLSFLAFLIRFFFFFLTISTIHALYNIVLLYHSLIYSFHLKLWSDRLDFAMMIRLYVGVKSVELQRSSYLR